MGLEPYYHQVPPEFQDESLEFKVYSYSRSGRYTLIQFTFGDELEWSGGEILYKDKEIVASSAGELDLGIKRRQSVFGGKAEYTEIGDFSNAVLPCCDIPINTAKDLTNNSNIFYA